MRMLLIILPILAVVLFILSIVSLVKFLLRRKRRSFFAFIFCLIAFIILSIIITVLLFVLPLSEFVSGSFSRVLPPMQNGRLIMYNYNFQNFEYRTNIYTTDTFDGLPILEVDYEETTDNLFRISYRISSWPNTALIVEPAGEMLVRSGPPFTLQLYFADLNEEIMYIHFNKCDLINNDSSNILDSEKIYITNTISLFGSSAGGREKEVAVTLFKGSNNLYIHRTTGYAVDVIKDEVEDYDFQDRKKEIINNGIITGVIIGFRNIPINYLIDDEITITIDLDVILTDGQTRNIKFEGIFIKQYEEGKMRNWFPPDSYDLQREE